METLDTQSGQADGPALLRPPPAAPDCCAKEQKVGPVTKPKDDLSDLTRDLIAVRDRRDRAAFGRLFDYFAPRLKGMMLRSGLRDGQAEDVVQDVMLAVWQKAAQFDPHRAEAAGWIYGIARNRRIDLARRRPITLPEEMPEPESLEPDPAQILALQQEARHLAEALDRLAPEQAEALRAAYFDDISHRRISEVQGLPLGTIKSRIRLGLERLRHELRNIAP
ncbi:UNVERIFIED_CONTAM: rpoE [Trichonephila clavipes]